MADLVPTPSILAGPVPASENPVIVYLARLNSEHSRRAMALALRRALGVMGVTVEPPHFPWRELRYPHVQALRTGLLGRFAPATVNQTLAAVRGVLREAWRLGQLASEQYHRAVDVQDLRYEKLPAGRVIGYEGLVRIFSACKDDPSPSGARDAALLAVMVGGGLRRAEVARLDVADLQADGSVRIRSGKGCRDRLVYLGSGGWRALGDWLGMRGRAPGALFVHIGKGKKISAERITTQAVWHVLEQRAAQVGLRIRPHDLRRTFITRLLEGGIDVLTVQRLAGHADPRTTSRYDRRAEDAKRRACETLEIPY